MDFKNRCNLWRILPVLSKSIVAIRHTQHPLHMSTKATLAACLALILAIVAAVFITRGRSGESTSAKSPAAAKGGSDQAPATGGIASTRKAPAKSERDRREIRHSELVEKYGESRTNLSKHITGNIVDLLQDTVEMGEMATSGQLGGAFGGPDAGLRMGLGRVGNELNLTEDQRGKAKALYAEFQKRQIDQSKETIDRLRKDPTAMMELMLASDAFARGQIDEAEFKKLQQDSGKDLNGVLNPLDQRNFRGGRPLNDETFLTGFKAILDPEQAATLEASVGQQNTGDSASAANEGSITNLPSMELEKLDTTIESVKKVTTGIKGMMEGFGGLQDLGPMLEQQRRQREGQTAPDKAAKSQ